ncbi:multiheme C-type cytochrome [Calderihabitans maritimus]|uniref:Multiheme C-type cytochrome n=2 Tax=Calderihabitans maritimus TaxID=1246530 RepID=A0A1Z5HQI9_9FIRM|nr:multiheme C-type cytochrome [Calderihabitans maritimus]
MFTVLALVVVVFLGGCASQTTSEQPKAKEEEVKQAAGEGEKQGNLEVVKAGYVGSEKCTTCHSDKYNDFKVSGHPWKLKKAEVAKNNPLPLPKGYSWDDISYVIGGYKWKARYMDKDGYIITTTEDGPGSNQYNMMVGSWSDYHAGEKLPYDCGKCHTTGYSEEGNQDGLPGIVGTWAEPGIGCEACHGPGAEHVAAGGDKSKIKVDSSAALCGQCHIRGEKEKIPAKGGFIQHHEQYNELLASPHKNFDCTTCHDPHKKAEFSITQDCASCHSDVNETFTGSTMQKVGVTCVSCHMPAATKSAVKLGPYKGDVKTHLFRINTDPGASMFTEDGKYAKDFVTLDFVCLQCHQDKDIQWAASKVENIHGLGK